MKQSYIFKSALSVLFLGAALTINAQTEQTGETNVIFYESFDKLAGQGGTDGYFDNDVEAGVEVGAEDLLTTENLDNATGWGALGKVAICNKCIRIATKKKSGSITTTSIALDGKSATLTFNAAAQLADVTTLYVEASEGALLTYGEQVNLTKIAIELPESKAGETILANQTYSITISGTATSVALTFSTVSSETDKQRAYIDEIKVVQSKTNAVRDVTVGGAASNVTYDLCGMPIGNMSNFRGIYICGGKKYIRK